MHVVLFSILRDLLRLFEGISSSEIMIRVLILVFALWVSQDDCELIDYIWKFAAEMEFLRESDGLFQSIGVNTVNLPKIQLIRLLVLVCIVLLPA